MKYEIQHRAMSDPDVWYIVAESDIKEWAEKTVYALSLCTGEEFRVKERM